MTIYAKIENGQFVPAKNESIEVLQEKGFLPFEEDLVSKYFAGQAEIQGETLVDITDTDQYKAKIAAQEKATKLADLQAKLDELDKKRVRAMAEPQIKDESTGQTWLEYYNLQISNLRIQIVNLG